MKIWTSTGYSSLILTLARPVRDRVRDRVRDSVRASVRASVIARVFRVRLDECVAQPRLNRGMYRAPSFSGLCPRVSAPIYLSIYLSAMAKAVQARTLPDESKGLWS